jgi:hypothetical protein
VLVGLADLAFVVFVIGDQGDRGVGGGDLGGGFGEVVDRQLQDLRSRGQWWMGVGAVSGVSDRGEGPLANSSGHRFGIGGVGIPMTAQN